MSTIVKRKASIFWKARSHFWFGPEDRGHVQHVVNMPAGMSHSFKNESNKSAKVLIMVALAGLENMFFEVGVQLAKRPTRALPPSQEEIEKQ